MSAAPVERGAIVYDNGTSGNLDSDFTRDTITVDDQGIWRAINERRFGEIVDHSPLLTWTTGDAPLTTGVTRVFATGWDHDGTTPLVVVQNLSQQKLLIFRGDDFDLVGTLVYVNDGLEIPGAEGSRYFPNAAIIHHGLIVLLAEREENLGTGFQTVGTSLITTQDYGATFERVPQVGGGFDIPEIAGGVSAGMARGRNWSFLNPFPVGGLNDVNQVWFPWADYIVKSGGPKGGQVGLFQATRENESGPWTVLPNRLVFEQWIPEDDGGLHAHTAAVTTGGLISHWGDVGYRNHTLFHEFDLSEYQTAPVATHVVYGGYHPTVSIERVAPQPVAAAPAPTSGEHFASADLSQEIVFRFGAMTTGNDTLRVSAPVTTPYRSRSGVYYDGADILHLQWVSGVGYVSGSGGNQFLHYSPDGNRWAALNMPVGLGGTVWLYGNKLLTLDGDDHAVTADLPAVSSLAPLQIAPGGTNRLAPAMPIQSPPGEGNTRRQVEFAEGTWRYVDNLQPLAHQPEPPPFPLTTPVYEVTLGSISRDLGTWWLQADGQTLSAEQPNLLDLWVYNLGSQSIQLSSRLRVPGVGGATATEIAYQSNVNFDWVPLGIRQDFPYTGDGQFAVHLQTSRTGSVNAGGHFLVAARYFGELNTPTYPLEPLAEGSHEMEVVGGFKLEDDWSAGLVFQWPHNAPQSMTGKMPVASLRATDGSYLEVSVEYTGSTTARLVVELIRPGLAPVRMNFSQNILRGEVAEIVLGKNDNAILGTARIGGRQPIFNQLSLSVTPLLAFNEFAWASGTGATVTTVNPLFFMVDDEIQWSAEQQLGWLRSTLEGRSTFRINPYPGDFNYNGVVDEVDLAVWEAKLGSTSDLAADANLSGVVDQADRDIWEEYLGTRAPSPFNPHPGDFDFNGIVDLADYLVWRDTRGSSLHLNADADRNGIVDQLDYNIWQGQFGKLAPIPEQPLPGDFNFDHVVNAADYSVWRATRGSRNALAADANQDRIVNEADLVIWRSQFGKTLPEESGASSSQGEGFAELVGESFSIEVTQITSRIVNPDYTTSSTNRAKELLILDAAYAEIESRDGFSAFVTERDPHGEETSDEAALAVTLLGEVLLGLPDLP